VIAGPLLLLLLPLVMAGVVYVLLRWTTLSALLAVGTALALGIAVITLPLDQPSAFWGGRQIAMGESVTFLGRELVLEQADRLAMAFLFFSAAGVFFLAWRFAQRSLLFPMGLGLLGLLSSALLIRPLIYAALLIEIAAALSVFALQTEGRLPTRGGLRYLTFTTLALPGLLVTHWLLERYALTPDETGLLSTATVLLTVSFALLLGVAPFHSWVTAMAEENSVPLAGAFVLTIGNGAVWFLLLDFLQTYPWLGDHPGFGSFVSAAGLAMVAGGGLLAPAQRRLGSLMGYAALVDTGAALIALGLNSRTGVTLVLLSLAMRSFGLILLAGGLSGLRAQNGGSDHLDALHGLGWKAPWSTAALVFGGLSIAGLPVSAGFVCRWALCRTLATFHPISALILILAGVGVAAAMWRALAILLAHAPAPKDRSVLTHSEGWLTALAVIVAILVCVGAGLFPQTIAPLAARLAGTYTFFLP
jgi:formate hydrogenlyase subunit 3/multisubunit Na+/H+ antiporter MnhD subunit